VVTEMIFRKRRGKAVVEEYERTALDDLLRNLGGTEPLFGALRELVHAPTEQDQSEVLRRHPELASERGRAALRTVVSFAMMTGLVLSLPRLQALQERLRAEERPPEPGRALTPDDSVYTVLNHFCEATISADQKFLRTQDASDIRLGIRIWEELNARGQLRDVPPEALVDVQLQAAMLYARRYEVDTDARDLEAAFALLRAARQHAVPGGDTDLGIRLSSATWLMLRFETQHDPADLEQAIAAYTELIDAYRPKERSAGVASANLGRALLARRELTGSPHDAQLAREAYGKALSWLPEGDPALAVVQQRLTELHWRTR
jgi:hypothetical protein